MFRSQTSNSGGLALYIKDGILFRVLDEFCFMYNHLESLFIEITIKNQRFMIEVMYRGPRSNFEDFMYDYTKILLELGDRKAYICGNFKVEFVTV